MDGKSDGGGMNEGKKREARVIIDCCKYTAVSADGAAEYTHTHTMTLEKKKVKSQQRSLSPRTK